MSMNTVLLLLKIYEYLEAVEHLGTWRLVTPGNVSELEAKVRLENYDIPVT